MYSDPILAKYDIRGVQNKESVNNKIRQAIEHYNKYKFGTYIISTKNNKLDIGFCSLGVHEDTSEVEIGFAIKKEHWNNGYATEACKACVEHLFTQTIYNKIIATIHKENKASINTVTKLGMIFEKEVVYMNVPHVIYSLHKHN